MPIASATAAQVRTAYESAHNLALKLQPYAQGDAGGADRKGRFTFDEIEENVDELIEALAPLEGA